MNSTSASPSFIQGSTPEAMPRPLTRRKLITVLVGFLGTLGVLFAVIMWVLSPHMQKYRQRGVFFECIEVVSGHELVMRPLKEKGAPRDPFRVRVVGIQAPPMEAGPQAAEFSRRTGIPEGAVPRMGEISRNTLAVWLFKQSNIMLDFDRDNPVFDDAGRLLVRVSLAMVDVGKMQLREGQAIVRDEPHPHTDLYMQYTQQAQDARIGIWRKLRGSTP